MWYPQNAFSTLTICWGHGGFTFFFMLAHLKIKHIHTSNEQTLIMLTNSTKWYFFSCNPLVMDKTCETQYNVLLKLDLACLVHWCAGVERGEKNDNQRKEPLRPLSFKQILNYQLLTVMSLSFGHHQDSPTH